MQDDADLQTESGALLWQPTPERIANSGLTAFLRWVNHQIDEEIKGYDALWQWSVANPAAFWESVWRYYDIAPEANYTHVLDARTMPEAHWFKGAELNFAEYLLRQGDRAEISRAAIFAESESVGSTTLSWVELREQVVCMATYLRAAGITPGDRVVAYLPMSAEAVVALLACVSIGAVWSSCSPDFGADSVVERFAQIAPKVLFAVSSYRYNGKAFDRSNALSAILQALPSLTELIYLPWADTATPRVPAAPAHCSVRLWQQCLATTDMRYSSFEFEPMAFEAPLWIMYSSGTTGAPKGIVHSQGGALIEYVKYAWLHDDMQPQSVKFFVTTTGWTMFNILVGGMMAGAAIVTYDGCPTYPTNDRLWDICDRHQVTYFGASPSYVNALMQDNYSPRTNHRLRSVKTIALTGSPSSSDTFAWFYRNVHQDLHIISMSGGTDISSAFIAGAASLSVYAGEIQCACLGVDVAIFDDTGQLVPDGEDGELVIRQPMPSMPLRFWNDPDGTRYRQSYFADFPGVWRHGDLIRKTTHGGYIISGRSDATLNRFGVRIGTAEIYRAIESISEIKDSLIVSLELPGARFFMPLFVVMQDGCALTASVEENIAETLSQRCSPRHVPDQVYAIAEVPYTLTGKKLEVPVKKLLLGMSAKQVLNMGAIANPGAMDYFLDMARTIKT